MTDLFAARSQMAISLAFHIVFAAVGIAMPVLMVIAEWRWRRTGDEVYLDLAKRWARGSAILFAVGAMSGTVLSFELGLLWPEFMRYAGPLIGMPFSLEGFAFFTEAIFLGIYLYGWKRISPARHMLAGVAVAVSGVVSGIFVVMANSWMNTPAGFRLVDGVPVDIDPFVAMLNPGSFSQTLHMSIAAYAATGIAVAGIHAFMLRRDPANVFHRHAMSIALFVAVPAMIVQPVSGDLSARFVAQWQPVKLASLEGQFQTQQGAPLRIGGIPDMDSRQTRYAVEIPRGLSFLAFHDPNATVKGLNSVNRTDWPHVPTVHIAFQIMVGLGIYMALLGVWVTVAALRTRSGIFTDRRLLGAIAVAAPMGFAAIEAGWTVTEVGRQPWIIQGVMRTADAVTPMPALVIPFAVFSLLYLMLGVVVTVLLYRHIVKSPI
ncbi:MAG: cytochrome ubiquinol oxidase subunit I [Gemmatimonadaceae bacterium]